MTIPVQKSPEDVALLNELMGWLEKNSEMKRSPDEAKLEVAEFAMQVFRHADDEDRSGNATKETALGFHGTISLSLHRDTCRHPLPVHSSLLVLIPVRIFLLAYLSARANYLLFRFRLLFL